MAHLEKLLIIKNCRTVTRLIKICPFILRERVSFVGLIHIRFIFIRELSWTKSYIIALLNLQGMVRASYTKTSQLGISVKKLKNKRNRLSTLHCSLIIYSLDPIPNFFIILISEL